MMGFAQEVRRVIGYRHFIVSAVRHELQVKFANSWLGGLWLLLNPLAMVLIYTLVLSVILRAKVGGIDHPFAYSIYLVAGIVGWTLFSEVLSRMLGAFLEYAHILKKMAIPRLSPFVIVGLGGLVNSVLLVLAVLVVFALIGGPLGWPLLGLPLLMLVTATLAGALGAVLALVTVFVRDLTQIMPIVLQLGFWATPIVYTRELIPATYQWVFDWHPLVPLIEQYQRVLAYGQPVLWEVVAAYGVVALAMLTLFWWLFVRAEAEVMDAL